MNKIVKSICQKYQREHEIRFGNNHNHDTDTNADTSKISPFNKLI